MLGQRTVVSPTFHPEVFDKLGTNSWGCGGSLLLQILEKHSLNEAARSCRLGRAKGLLWGTPNMDKGEEGGILPLLIKWNEKCFKKTPGAWESLMRTSAMFTREKESERNREGDREKTPGLILDPAQEDHLEGAVYPGRTWEREGSAEGVAFGEEMETAEESTHQKSSAVADGIRESHLQASFIARSLPVSKTDRAPLLSPTLLPPNLDRPDKWIRS